MQIVTIWMEQGCGVQLTPAAPPPRANTASNRVVLTLVTEQYLAFRPLVK